MAFKDEYTDGMKSLRELSASQESDKVVIVRGGEPYELPLSGLVAGGAITKAETGWGDYRDSAATEASPLVVNDARVQVTIDKLGANTRTIYEPETGTLWDSTSNAIITPSVGMHFTCRLDWKAKTTTNNAFYDLQMDIGSGSPIVITEKTLTMVKGISTEQRFTETISGYALDTFLANGGKLYFDSRDDGANISIYDIGIFIAVERVL